jgi:DNA-3-methyladenine glycosylase
LWAKVFGGRRNFECSLTNEVLPRSFYERNTLTVAQELLGKILVRQVDGLKLTGRIVETEAYRGADDPASHAYRGMTKRNMVMFGNAGIAYVYIAFGLNYCLNATTEQVGTASAVLIRAIEPVGGIDSMIENRPHAGRNLVSLTNGPGKLCQAMKITRELNGTDFIDDGVLSIHNYESRVPIEIKATPRVGITRASRRLWRYYVKGNRFVSRH